jgi:hypothetical protein
MEENDGLIREVNEAMRQEKLQHFFSHFGRYIVAASAAIILATLGYVMWQNHISSRYEAATLEFYQAVKQEDAGKSYAAREAFEVISNGSDTSLAMLAKLWLVKLKYEAEKPEEAATMAANLLKETASFAAWPQYRDWLTLYLPASESTTINNTYRLTNIERLAISHIKEGKKDEAAIIYRAIAEDNATPPSMRERASLILETYLREAVVASKTPDATVK